MGALAASLAAEPRENDALAPGAIARLGAPAMMHPGTLHSLEFTPDSRRIVTIADDAWVWDAATGELIRKIALPRTSVMCGALSPDGKTVALAENGKTLFLYDAVSGEERARLTGGNDRSHAMAMSADGKWLASGDGQSVILWDAEKTKISRRWKSKSGSVEALQFSPDGRSVVSATDGAITMYALDEAKPEIVLEGAGGFIAWLRFSPDGAVLAGSCDVKQGDTTRCSMRFWDAKTGKKLRDVGGSFNAGAFSPDGKWIASTGLGFVHVHDAANGKVLHRLPRSNEHVWCVSFSPDGKMLAAGQGQQVRRWRTDTWEEFASGSGHGGPVKAVAFSPDGRSIATGGLDNTIRIWSWPEAQEMRRIDGVGDAWGVQQLAFSPDGRTLCATAWVNFGDMYHLYDVGTGALVKRFGKGHEGRAGAVFLADGKELLTGRMNGTLAIWDAASGRLLREVGAWKGDVGGVAMAADGRHAFWMGDYQGLGLRDLSTGKDVRWYAKGSHHHGRHLLVSPDGDWLAVGNRVWDVETASVLSDPNDQHSDQPNAISRTGGLLFTGHRFWDALTRLDVPSGLGELRGNSAAFSPDGTVLVIASDEGATVWDMTGILQNGRLPVLALMSAEMEALWETLGGADAWAAHQAAWKLTAGGKSAVDFLDARLHPAEVPGKLRVDGLRSRFTEADFDARELAARRLVDLGVELLPEDWHALRRPAPNRSSQPGRFPPPKVDLLPPPVLRPLPERMRASRAILALRRSVVPEAATVLAKLADGAPQSPITREAKIALKQFVK
jgi:WD40 repeat protein